MNSFQKKGTSFSVLEKELKSVMERDRIWENGKTFGFVYHPGNEIAQITSMYYNAYMYNSNLNPFISPSLRKYEKEIIGMTAAMVHGNSKVTGTVTTGGTESIFSALKVARDYSREVKKASAPFEVILPDTVHPAFLKACHILCLNPVTVPVRKDKRADPEAMEKAITANTILLTCSAPCFPYGVVDPVQDISEIARNKGLLCHVDACMGGYMLPFLEDLGFKIPIFDFRIPGVTSISMDAHKYGYAPKGVSVILYRDHELRMKQFFIYTDWCGGIYGSTTFQGTREGGPMAACRAIMCHLGREGYRKLAKEVMETTLKIKAGITRTGVLNIISDPEMSVLAFTSDTINIYALGDALKVRGWNLDRLQFPKALHMTVNRLNVGKEDAFIKDITELASSEKLSIKHPVQSELTSKLADKLTNLIPEGVIKNTARLTGSILSDNKLENGGMASLYNLSASIKNRKSLKKMVLNMIDGMY
ncbi:pyridoxal phosphate-dependent decarboxylase family protein [Saccharicrinis sp. FJH54]|uniref:pyridoxal phosphate-dependent decarboxylase family protein n=1 Tax=Saccharicrinis sp. FJH54 TaxID=3344665 RepID=UPI0035D43775